MSDYEAEARARLSTKEGRIEAITLRAFSRRFGSGNSNYIRECADDEYELLGFLAAAEARAERLATACAGLVDVFDYVEYLTRNGGFIPALLGIDWQQRLSTARAALTAPATQPDERAAAERATDERAAEAWADSVALFILHKVTEATSLTLAEITPNLTAPGGWLSFARLWRADYIIVTGDLVQPTERGIAAMRELLICVADVELDATDGAAKEEK